MDGLNASSFGLTQGKILGVLAARRLAVWLGSVVSLLLSCGPAWAAKPIAAAREPNINGDFEILSRAGLPEGWDFMRPGVQYFEIRAVGDTRASGRSAMFFGLGAAPTPPKDKLGIQSKLIPVSDVRIWTLSFMLKLERVIQGKDEASRAVGEIWFYDGAKKPISHTATVVLAGTKDWTEFSDEWVLPADCRFVQLKFALVRCTGKMWLDNVRLKPIAVQPAAARPVRIPAGAPVVIPKPRQERYSGKKLPLPSPVNVSVDKDCGEIIKEHLDAFLAGHGLTAKRVPLIDTPGASSEGIILARPIPGFLQTRIPGNMREALDREQGYVLAALRTADDAPVVVLAAKTDEGLFYGLQTLKQMMVKEGGGPFVYEAVIGDYPLIKTRGAVMGAQSFKHNKEFIARAASFKMNRILGSGGWLDRAFVQRFREPLTPDEAAALKDYLRDCQRHFIVPSVGVKPTWPADYIKNKTMDYTGTSTFDYLDENEFSLLFRKLDQMYECGVRVFALHFDDLRFSNQHVLHDPAHINKFGHIGNAHVYLVERVSQYLKTKDPNIKVQMVPMAYTNPLQGDDDFLLYLRACAQLPSEIDLINVGTMERKAAEYHKKITGRFAFIWDNYFCVFEEHGFAVLPPFPGHAKDIASFVAGYVFLPMLPNHEKDKGLYWLTVADFMWDPEHYDPAVSAQRARTRGM